MKKIIPFLYCILVACTNSPKQEAPAQKENERIKESEKIIPYAVVRSIPHDTTSFTEGLLIHDGKLFESTGHTDSYPLSRSLFGIVNQNTGKIDVKAEIDKNRYFGEGIAFLKNKVYQLTDTTRIGFIYDARTYKPLGEFHYAGDGWALTTNGTYLIMSNGSGTLYYRDPVTFDPVKKLMVTADNVPVDSLNELELIHGYIYANKWLTNHILKIDTTSGRVVGKLDLSMLSEDAASRYPGSAEMNGIAYDSTLNKIYVTGKLWPTIYEIKFDN
ncbi:MAG TPA: glutaminyl-peptide cyclotransferase [Puia sp.]|nr:glutaminyl-peptide cyclotransferase [Puia sp.]